jgi:hypothetical protein
MKRLLLSLTFGTMLLPSVGLAHDGRYWETYDRRYGYERAARPGDPGYYCHRHTRKLSRDDTRRHCHSIYNDPHGVFADRYYPPPWWRR